MKSLLIATLALAAAFADAHSIGTLLQRDYTVYTSMPINVSTASAQGWAPISTTCVPGLGIPYTQTGGAPDEKQPLWLYFTPAGQVSGTAVLYLNHIEKEKKKLIQDGYIVPYPGQSGVYYNSVGFRSNTDACSNSTSEHPLGDRLVMHPQGIAHSLPLSASDAKSRGWVKGSCFDGMGTHWFRDITMQGSLSWEADNILPLIMMYDEESPGASGYVQAFFFASTVVQQTLIPPHANQWEPIPLPDILMCKNLCNSSCTFHGTDFYSTLHIYLNDRKPVTCHNGCTTACCPKN